MASYSSRVRADAARWVAAGLIDRRTADAIAADVEARDRRSLSFGSILAIMAALLLGAAILIFVASNWEAIPRLGRVGALFVIIFTGYAGGALLKLYDHSAIAEAVWLIAAAAFGGSIALIGQMYHLSGDETQAILVWCAGTAVAAAALRSGPLTIAAVALAAAWLVLREVDFWRDTNFPYHFLIMAVALWLVAHWTDSAASRHLILLSLVLYAVLLAVEHHREVLGIAGLLVAVSAILFALAVFAPEQAERIVRLDGLLPVHALIGFLAGIFMIQLETGNDEVLAFALAAAVGLAGIVAAVVLAGRESRGLRWLAYTGFALQLCMIYAVMIQDMLGTAGFLLAAGVVLGLLAFAIIRIEKGMKEPRPAGGAAA